LRRSGNGRNAKEVRSYFPTFDRQPLRFTIGEGQLIPGFEEAVVGMKPGDSKTTELPVEQAFGPYLEEGVIEVPKNKFAR
jgi:peptidylprolyl isomerase